MSRAALATALLAAIGAASSAAAQEFRLSEDTDQWTAGQPLDPASPAGQLEQIRRTLAAGQYERAESLASRFIDRHPDDPAVATAYLYRGDSHRARHDHYEALFDYEYVARVFPGSEAFVRALERELEIARLFATGTKRKLWGIRWVDASDEAEELLIRIQERLPGSSLAEDAGLALGEFYFRRRDMTLAAEAYSLFIENYPRSPHLPTARRRLIYAHLASFKGPEFDAGGLYEARARLRELMVVEPAASEQIGAEALLQRIDESDARKMLETARWYLRVEDLISAELTLRRLIARYPNVPAGREAMELVQEIRPRLPKAVQDRMQVPAPVPAGVPAPVPAPAATPAAAETPAP